jgi:soluble lytic murein transglycosylase-like protein
VLFTYISTCFACDVHSKVNFSVTRLNRDAYRAEITAAALEFGVDEALLRAVVHAESAFTPNALSKKGAQGLMQLMPGTADDLGVDNPFDATQNSRGGAQYLAQQLKNFQGDERLAMAAYNAGPANVVKYGGVPPFDETQVYVSRVSTLRDRYRQSN